MFVATNGFEPDLASLMISYHCYGTNTSGWYLRRFSMSLKYESFGKNEWPLSKNFIVIFVNCMFGLQTNFSIDRVILMFLFCPPQLSDHVTSSHFPGFVFNSDCTYRNTGGNFLCPTRSLTFMPCIHVSNFCFAVVNTQVIHHKLALIINDVTAESWCW